jgi:tetratricopeptide (TPR) repeat protein
MSFRVPTEQRRYYLAAGVALMLAGVAFRTQHTVVGLILLAGFPALIVASRFEDVEFDGQTIRRRGPLALVSNRIFEEPISLTLDEVELVATDAGRTHMTSSRVRYRYRTVIVGNGLELALLSSSRGYRGFVKALFEAVGEQKLDPRSSELLQYWDATAHIESLEVNQELLNKLPTQVLRSTANNLGLAGRMRQAMNIFTLAYKREPGNAHLLYEMGRFLHTVAAVENPRLLLRSNACLRLAAHISHNEPHLLERIGETYCERYDFDRATRCFERAIRLDPTLFRAYVGLAEIAFRAGKLARVAHFYHSAAQSATDPAQMGRARREARYYERLSNDDEYLEAEVRRVTFLQNLRWMRAASTLIFFASWLTVGILGRLSPMVEETGLALMASSGATWLGTTLGLQWRSKRLSIEIANSES